MNFYLIKMGGRDIVKRVIVLTKGSKTTLNQWKAI
jgi:hypothetical protein